MKRDLPHLLILAFVTLTYGVLTHSTQAEPREIALAEDTLAVLDLCETAIAAGRLPDVSGWAATRPHTATSLAETHLNPTGTALAVQVQERSWGEGVQLSCRVTVDVAHGPISEQEQAAVLMAFLQERGRKIAAQTHEANEPTALGQGWVQVGYTAKAPADGGCPVGAFLATIPEPPTIQLSVADQFTWCD